MAEVAGIKITQDDGCGVAVRLYGSGAPACVLIHGFGDGAYVWDEFVRSIDRLHQVVAVELRGHGDSDWDRTGRYPVRRFGQDILNIVRTLRLEPVIAIGHSLGAEIALSVATAQKGVCGLLLVEPSVCADEASIAILREEFLERIGRTFADIPDYTAWMQSKWAFAAASSIERWGACALEAMDGGGFRLKCDPALVQLYHCGAASSDRLALVAGGPLCPTLIVHGAGSSILTRTQADVLAGIFRHCSVRTVPQAGHAVMVDNPEGFLAAAGPFLAQLRQSVSRPRAGGG